MKSCPAGGNTAGRFFILILTDMVYEVQYFVIKYTGTSWGKENGRGKTKKKWSELWKTEEENQFCSGKRGFVMDSRNRTHITHCIYVCLFYRT